TRCSCSARACFGFRSPRPSRGSNLSALSQVIPRPLFRSRNQSLAITSHARPRRAYVNAHGRLPHAHSVCNLLGRKSFKVSQYEGCSFFIWQTTDRHFDQSSLLSNHCPLFYILGTCRLLNQFVFQLFVQRYCLIA